MSSAKSPRVPSYLPPAPPASAPTVPPLPTPRIPSRQTKRALQNQHRSSKSREADLAAKEGGPPPPELRASKAPKTPKKPRESKEPKSNSPPPKTTPPSVPALELVAKFYESETIYSGDLEACQMYFVTKLSLMDEGWKKDFMTDPDIKPLITAFEALSKQTHQFYEDINQAVKKHQESGTVVPLGFIFVNHEPMFAHFPQYHEIYQRASKKLQALYMNSDFMLFEKQAKENSPADSPVRSSPMMFFFSLPLPRLDVYMEVMRNMIAALSETDPDLPYLKEAEAKLTEIDKKVGKVNESLQLLGRLQLLQAKFEKKLGGGTVNIIEKGRQLIHEGPLKKQSKRSVLQKYHFHLFNDVLLYSEVNGSGKFVLHRQMPLAACRVDALETDIDSIKFHKFKLASSGKSFQVIAPNARGRTIWLTKLKEAIEACAGEGTGDRTVAAEWENDFSSNSCNFCDTKFNLVERRHHCRKCGKLCCSACSPHRVILTNIHTTKKSRICNKCNNEIEVESRNSFGLNVALQKATYLSSRKAGGVNDRSPYCIVSLRQIHFIQQKIPVVKNSNNPIWGRKGITSFAVDNISAAKLHFEIWDQRPMRNDVFLGQCETSLANMTADFTNLGPNTKVSHSFEMQLKPRNAKDKHCSGNLFFTVEVTMPLSLLDKGGDCFSLLRRHTSELSKPPAPIAVVAVMILHHNAKQFIEVVGTTTVQNPVGTPLIVVKDHKPTCESELHLREGDLFWGLEQPRGGIWIGEDERGNRGEFPAFCVKVDKGGHLDMASKLRSNFQYLESLRDEIQNASGASVCLPYEAIVNEVLGSATFSALSERKKVIYEMLKSERVYVERLRRFERLYAEPLKEAATRGMLKRLDSGTGSSYSPTKKVAAAASQERKKLLNHPDLTVLLNSFEQILNTNQSFIQKLAETIVSWDGSISVGETFSIFAKHFTIYGHFASAYEKALLTLKSPLFKDFILCQQHTVSSGEKSDDNKFEALLIEPVQRTPRYRMLLEDCLKKTDAKHDDYPKLQVAIKLVKETCQDVNEIVRRREDAEKLLDVDDMITQKPKDFTCIAQGRRFLQQAKMMKACRRANKDFTFLLFTDLLIYGKAGPKDTVKFHRAVDLKNAEIEEDLSNPNSFCILASPKSFTIIASNVAEKENWVSKIKENNSHSIKGSQKAALWTSDKSSKTCKLCHKKFLPLIRMRHHCRVCGHLVCGECSKHTMLLKHIHDKKQQRACDSCFSHPPRESFGGDSDSDSDSTIEDDDE